MEKATKLISFITRILALLVLVIVVGLSLAMAYIMFAPDSFPKPFYLTYIYPTPVPTKDGGSTGTATATPEPTAAPEVKPGGGLMVSTGTKIINLAEPTAKNFIRVTIVLEFNPTDPKYPEMTAEEKTAYTTTFTTDLTAKMPIIDDAIITMMSTKTFDDLYTAAGKEELRKQLLASISERLPDYKLLSLYFTEFVVE